MNDNIRAAAQAQLQLEKNMTYTDLARMTGTMLPAITRAFQEVSNRGGTWQLWPDILEPLELELKAKKKGE